MKREIWFCYCINFRIWNMMLLIFVFEFLVCNILIRICEFSNIIRDLVFVIDVFNIILWIVKVLVIRVELIKFFDV